MSTASVWHSKILRRGLLGALVAIGSLGASGDASALPCVADKFGGNVNCTANDISITSITDIVVTDDGCTSAEDTVTFNATLLVVTTASTRYDIGLFIGEDGVQAQAGECSVYALPTGPAPFVDADGDQCGDSTSSQQLAIAVTGVTVSCEDANGDGQLDIAHCTTWDQNSNSSCTGAQDVEPGTAAKCNCPLTPTDIPIFVPDPVCITNADCEEIATGCNVGVCDVANPNADAFGCVFTPDDSQCNDGLFCNGVETCDAVSGCVAGTAPNCNDAIPCTVDSCNETTDSCVNSPDNSVCNDGQFCNGVETCSAVSGCVAGTAPNCNDAIPCTVDSCNETTDACVNSPDDTACNDGLFCNGLETCSAVSGCVAGAPVVCNDGVPCTVDTCDEANDTCLLTPNDALCNDLDECTLDVCDALTGCAYEEICQEIIGGICRSPGFWSTHGGYEKNGANLTQEVIDAVGSLEVCGQVISETSNLSRPYLDGLGLSSALEGLCVNVKGETQRALYRHLVAAALNCVMTATGTCDEIVGEHTDISFDACNTLCEGGDVGAQGPTVGECIAQLDCYNNGGEVIAGDCAFGNCEVTGELCGGDYGNCPLVLDLPQDCVNFEGNCHDAEFCQVTLDICPDNVGPASSSRACQEARGNFCTIDNCN